jgi:hypothetical protein
VEKLLSAAFAGGNFQIFDGCLEFLNPVQKEIYQALKKGEKQSNDSALDAALAAIILRSADELKIQEIEQLKAELGKEYYKERRKVLSLAIRNAEANGNDAELAAALEEMKNLPTVGE